MDRRSLILRRFGPLDFGLGYFEDGVWVDHTSLTDGGVSLGISEGAFGEIHDLLECCRMSTTTARAPEMLGSGPIALPPATLGATLGNRREHGQPVARRSSAG